MILFATIRIALRALRRNTLRTLLTMLGIIIGVAAVIVVVALGHGAKAELEKRVAALGNNVVTVRSGFVARGGVRMGFGSAPTLTEEDYMVMRRELSGAAGISPEVGTTAQVAAGNQNTSVEIRGVSADFLEIRAWPLADGENFTEQDVRNANKVAVIGKTTKDLLFGEAPCVGEVIRIKNAPFTIVGELTPKGASSFGGDQDDAIFVPYTAVLKRLTGQSGFRSILIQAASPDLITTVTNEVTDLLRQRHRIAEGQSDDFFVRTQQETIEFFDASQRIMRLLLAGAAGVSLIVGGIGIMNIMLVSVTERTREIGVRLAVGARGRDILLQFLIEAVTLSVLGGALGVALGVASSNLLTARTQWATLISSDSILLAFIFSAAIGIFFGFYPARKAAQLDPIDALRYE
jgi:putative ABC transport system permease protein